MNIISHTSDKIQQKIVACMSISLKHSLMLMPCDIQLASYCMGMCDAVYHARAVYKT